MARRASTALCSVSVPTDGATMPPAHGAVARAFAAHERFLWSLCYRMTGSAADADDLVQETFTRALDRPPERMDEPLRPWLACVALNLARDLLRQRRRRGYVGPWLPSPIETGDADPPSHEPVLCDDHGRPITTEGRYDLIESVSFAFLLALEALTPRQRAVLLLRDVFDYSVQQTADALDISPDNVKTTHLRARRAMRSYDRSRVSLTAELQRRTRAALERFGRAIAAQDGAALEAILAEDIRMLSDGGGEYSSARVPVVGRARVARMWLSLAARRGPEARTRMLVVNGLPAIVSEGTPPRRTDAPRTVITCDVDARGRIRTLYAIVASRKLTALFERRGNSKPR